MADRPRRGRPSLEQELDLLRRGIVLPSTPDVAAAVAERLRTGQQPLLRRGRRPLLALAVAVMALLLLAAAVAAAIWGIGGVRFTFSDAPPASMPAETSQRIGGAQVSLDEAQRAVDFRVLLPELAGLESPDVVYLDRLQPVGGSVALVYARRPGDPAEVRGGNVMITEFRADIGPEVFEKLVHSGVRVQEASVGGQPAYWVAGGSHFFFYRDASGRMVDDTIRLVGDTLIWESSGLTLRVEGAPSLEVALRVAASLR